ncbi:uncharacterized protein LOC127456039 [Myxocyprinus asiaticus]|uniref:uncharacterized protein LOC127456039 n=1 Tax=Myxocyprinus asiaticus TaxID=70543 RepID=UPI00222226E6|nr:uncharacterized protein LOC127456039 [Myxocyprinus asiaticus]XP_051580292.1 uncharacterized protein LOC127456039 [Myxocyprinus asiaticus]
MDKFWIENIDKTVRKETDLRIKRSVHIVKSSRAEFMKLHLASVEPLGRFTTLKKRGENLFQWRCERSRIPRGQSTGCPTKSKANHCGAYISFQFKSDRNIDCCIVRLQPEHSGHNLDSTNENVVFDSATYMDTDEQPNKGAVAVVESRVNACIAIQTNSTPSTQSDTDAQNKDTKDALTETKKHTDTDSAIDTSTVFKEVESILPLSCGLRKRRYPVSIGEVKRRVGPPENMSLASLVAYLREDKNKKDTLRQDFQKTGIHLWPTTTVTSLCSRVTEGEAADLGRSIGKLAATTIPFDDISVVDHQHEDISIKKLCEFKEMLHSTVTAVKAQSLDFNLATHGLGLGLLDVYTNIIITVTEKGIEKLWENR